MASLTKPSTLPRTWTGRWSLPLGEEVAIGILEEQQATYNEGGSFTLTKFDGTTLTI
jgi:hypothetical protein